MSPSSTTSIGLRFFAFVQTTPRIITYSVTAVVIQAWLMNSSVRVNLSDVGRIELTRLIAAIVVPFPWLARLKPSSDCW